MRWQKIGKRFFVNKKNNIKILDLGSGTGLVPLQIAGYLSREDQFVCSDISANVLSACKANVIKNNFKCHFEYLKLSGGPINVLSNSFDFITINAVIHHIPNFEMFFGEIERLLKIDGRLIIASEPNKYFYKNKFLWNNYKVTSFITSPKKIIYTVLKIMGLAHFINKIRKNKRDMDNGVSQLVEKINNRLISEGLINSPLTSKKITEIVDIHSPLAGGGYHDDRGIDILMIAKKHLPNFTVDYLETYDHLCKLTHKNWFTKLYSTILKKICPMSGSKFLVVLKKNG